MFYICYIERAKVTHKLLLDAFAENHFLLEEIGQDQSKKIDANSYIYKVIKHS